MCYCVYPVSWDIGVVILVIFISVWVGVGTGNKARKSVCVKEVERLKKNREDRRYCMVC